MSLSKRTIGLGVITSLLSLTARADLSDKLYRQANAEYKAGQWDAAASDFDAYRTRDSEFLAKNPATAQQIAAAVTYCRRMRQYQVDQETHVMMTSGPSPNKDAQSKPADSTADLQAGAKSSGVARNIKGPTTSNLESDDVEKELHINLKAQARDDAAVKADAKVSKSKDEAHSDKAKAMIKREKHRTEDQSDVDKAADKQ